MESQKKVLITGITGYVGCHVGKLLIEKCQEFEIRASARNMKKVETIKSTLGQDSERIKWVQADLNDEDSMLQAI